MRQIIAIGIAHQRLIMIINEVQEIKKETKHLTDHLMNNTNRNYNKYDDYFVYDLPMRTLYVDDNGTFSKLFIFGAQKMALAWPKVYHKLANLNYENMFIVQDLKYSYIVFSFDNHNYNFPFAYNIQMDHLIEWNFALTIFPLNSFSSNHTLSLYKSVDDYYVKLIFYGVSEMLPTNSSSLKIKQQGPTSHICQAEQSDPNYVIVWINIYQCKNKIDWFIKNVRYGAFIVGERLFSMQPQMVYTTKIIVGQKSYLARIPYEHFLQVGTPESLTSTIFNNSNSLGKTMKIVLIIVVSFSIITVIVYCLWLKSSHNKLNDPEPDNITKQNLKSFSNKMKFQNVNTETIQEYHDSKVKKISLCKHLGVSTTISKTVSKLNCQQ